MHVLAIFTLGLAATGFVKGWVCTENETDAMLSELATAVETRSALLEQMMGEMTALSSKVDAMASTLEELRPPYGHPTARVYVAKSSEGGYKLTFEEGKALCESQGAKIATRDQLSTAQLLGYERCACGWVEEGAALYPMVWPHPACGNIAGISQAGCGDLTRTYDVFCFA